MDEQTGEPSHDARPASISRRDLLVGAVLGGTALGIAACGSPLAPSASPIEPSPVPSQSPATAPSSASSVEPSPSPQPSAAPSPTLREMIAGLMVVGFRGSILHEAPWLEAALRDTRIGGVILFDRDQETAGERNVQSPRQLTALVDDLRAAAGPRDIVVSVDQEGGRVSRLSPANGFPAVASEAEIGAGSVAAGRTWAGGIATTLASVGINLNLAPVVDLDTNPRSPAIGALDRSFSADPDVVVKMATAEIEAHRAAGVRTTLKHFPGIGSSTTNTDFGVADVTRTWTATELEPFRRLIAAGHADLVMAGHVVNGQLDPDLPTSLSMAVVTDLLRGELGWNGIVVTDDLQAAAIDEAFGRDEAILLALEAGNDLLLFANQQTYDPEIVERVVDLVTSAVDTRRLPEARIQEAWVRIQRLFGPANGP